MSGDVQPRKRKDKKRKRDDDESSHGVHITKMAGDDVHLHVHEDHGTGGNVCTKILFFALSIVLLGVVALIILENRGSADLDTPLSESRFSNYFNGWVDEHREEEHDDHKRGKRSIEDHDDHDEEEDHSEADDDHDDDEHDDHDDDEHDDHDDDDHDDDDENVTEENVTEENATEENATEENATEENVTEENVTEENVTEENVTEENVTEEQTVELSNEGDNENDDDDDDDEDEDDDNVTEEQTVKLSKEDNDADDDDDNDDEDNATEEQTVELSNENDNNDNDDNDDDDLDNVTEEQTVELSKEDANDDEDNVTEEQTAEQTNEEDDDDDDDGEFVEPIALASTHSQSRAASKDNDDDDDDPFDEDDDDGTFESLETVVDNDAEEQKLLQEKARQQAEEAAKSAPPSTDEDDDDDGNNNDEAQAPRSWTALAVKILVGGILPFVARLVLIRNKDKENSNDDEPAPEINMKRRLTIASEEEAPPEDESEAPPLLDEDEEYSEEEIEIEEEIEYLDDDDEELEIDEEHNEMPTVGHYVPETFEQLSAMYRTTDTADGLNRADDRHFEEVPVRNSFIAPTTSAAARKPAAAVFNAPPPPPLVEAKIKHESAATPTPQSKIEMRKPLYSAEQAPTVAAAAAAADSPKSTKRQTTHNLDYRPEQEYQDDPNIEYDDDEIYEHDDEDDDLGEEEEEDEDDDEDYDVSDVDDADLMSRLEAKYGRLPASPAKEFESDEDPDDPTWTQIKPKQTAGGGGPQAFNDEEDDDDFDELFEQQLRKANEEMLRENNHAAMRSFKELTRIYPDKPKMFLSKAKFYDKLAVRKRKTNETRANRLLHESLQSYKRYLAFGKLVEKDLEFRAAAERCIEQMRFLGYTVQAVPIHEQLIERFNDVPWPRNQLVETYIMLNRLSDSILALRETIRRWPQDGFAQALYGYILKKQKDYANAVRYLFFAINSQANGTQHGRFYFSLGESLQRLGRRDEALIVYQRGANLNLYPSVLQRSLYNEPRLRAKPFWNKNETTYEYHFNMLERYWEAIQEEGLALYRKKGSFYDEKENLRDTGDWKQFELFRAGQPYMRNCLKAPTTCSLLREFTAATGCRRGQVKFSAMKAKTHVWPHCGPTNCRLRAHLGLKVPQNTTLRVGTEERTWTLGRFLIFDDSFEHEVWHNGTGVRLVLIVDFWHPDLSAEQRESLTPI